MSTKREIDWEKLGDLEDWNHEWRTAIDSGLSERYVPGEGDNPRVFIVGEAPGAQEDSALRPFVGDSGRILRELMASVGLFTGETPHFGEPNCWLTNVVHFRPPRNRTPTPAELKVARIGLRVEWIAVGRPRIIVPIGGTALKTIMGRGPYSILKMAGSNWPRMSNDGKYYLNFWPMIHPSFGIRNKNVIPLIEKDWGKFEDWLKATGSLK